MGSGHCLGNAVGNQHTHTEELGGTLNSRLVPVVRDSPDFLVLVSGGTYPEPVGNFLLLKIALFV